ncbi:MAG: phospholipase D-like domain-containing protein [Halobacteriota archaeon]
MVETGSTIDLLGTLVTDRSAQQALADLLAGDGIVYVVSGYFTYHGYRSIREDVVSFLDRSRENELVVIIGPASDQFSARIARDLWRLDADGQVHLYKYPRGLHAKLYLRDGPNPRFILGSANITRVAFEYNVELGMQVTADSREAPEVEPFIEWAETLRTQATSLRRRDVVPIVQVGNAVANWTNKAKLLPARNVAVRVTPVLVLIVLLAYALRFV